MGKSKFNGMFGVTETELAAEWIHGNGMRFNVHQLDGMSGNVVAGLFHLSMCGYLKTDIPYNQSFKASKEFVEILKLNGIETNFNPELVNFEVGGQ